MEVGLNWAAFLPPGRLQAGAGVSFGIFIQSVTNSCLSKSAAGPPRFPSSLPPATRASPAAGRLKRSEKGRSKRRNTWLGLGGVRSARKGGGGGAGGGGGGGSSCDHGHSGPEAREQAAAAAAAAAPAPRAGVVSQQNASPCGGAPPARGGESREREWALAGAAVFLRPVAGDSSPRPSSSAGPSRRPGESGGGGTADRAEWRTARRRRLSPSPFCRTPRLRPLRCRR